MIRIVFAVWWRDILLGWRRGVDLIAGLVFFAIIISLLPLAIGPDAQKLTQIAPAMLWIGILIAILPQIERLVALDTVDGGLDHIILIPASLSLIMLAKSLAAWMMVGLPMAVFAPLLGMMVGLTFSLQVVAALALGSLALILIGMLIATLLLGVQRRGLLMAVLVMPLVLPVLIFGVEASVSQRPHEALQLLLGVCLIFLAIAPPLSALALKQAIE